MKWLALACGHERFGRLLLLYAAFSDPLVVMDQ
jgi:hypothetical protein